MNSEGMKYERPMPESEVARLEQRPRAANGYINDPKHRPAVAEGFDTVAFDFDGTLAVRVWPDLGIGVPIAEGLEMLIDYWEAGYKVVVYTARPDEDEAAISWWLYEQTGLAVPVHTGKPSCGLYVDDLAFRPYWSNQ